MAGTFIDVEIESTAAADIELAKKLEGVCPVDIFKAGESGIELVEDNLDECVLCELCINAAPPGAIKILKLYSGESLAANPPGRWQ
jgi:NAD-dependent dihydropyrimidine dehydrogenase PreA subunit